MQQGIDHERNKKAYGTTNAACRLLSSQPGSPRRGESQDRLPQLPGRWRDAHGVVERGHFRVRRRGLAQVQGAPVVALEGGGGADQGAQRVAHGLPAIVAVAGPEPGAQHAHRLVGQHRHEQVALGALGLVVEHGAQPQLRLEAPEHRLDLGQGHVGAPHPLGVPVGDAAAQAVHAGMRGHAALDRLVVPADPFRPLAVGAGLDLDPEMAGDAGVGLLQAPDAALDEVGLALGAGLGQLLVDAGQAFLEAPAEALQNAGFLAFALRRVAPQVRLAIGRAVGFGLLEQPLQVADLAVRLRLLPVVPELAVPASRDHDIPVALPAQPGQVVLVGHAAVHDHHRIGAEAQLREHLLQGGALGDVAGEHPGLHDESAGIDDHRQGHQRAVAALLLRAPVPGQRIAGRAALEAGVGEVAEGHRRGQREQAHGLAEQVPLDRVPVTEQPVRGPVQRHVAEHPEVDAEHLAQGAGAAQPRIGAALRARPRHAPDDVRHGAAPLPAAEAQLVEQLRQPQHLQRLQGGMLDADRARRVVPGRAGVYPVEVRAAPLLRRRLAPPLQQDPGHAPGLGLDLGIQGAGAQRFLRPRQLLDPPAEQLPAGALDPEAAAQVHQRALAHRVAVAPGLDQAVRGVAPPIAGGRGLGLPDEHVASAV